MFVQSKNYSDARKQGALPIVLALVSSSRTCRVFSKEPITAEMIGFPVGLELYDGTHYTGEGTFGSLLISAWENRVISFGSIRDTLSPQNKDLIASYSQTQVTSYSMTLDNTDNWHAGIDEEFTEQIIEIWQGFNGVDFSEWQRLFQGEIIEIQVDNRKIRFVCQATQGGFFEKLTLPTAGRYENPYDAHAILPLVYGDTTENSYYSDIDTESSTMYVRGGSHLLPCIDTENGIYCIAAHAIESTSVDVYDAEQYLGSYPVSEADYEGQGIISYITIAPPYNGQISGSCVGKNLTNPIEIIEDLLDYCEEQIDGFSWLPHITSIESARNACSAYVAAGIIVSENIPAFWCTSILSNFLGDWWVDSQGRLHIYIDDGSGIGNIAGDLIEREHKYISLRKNTQSLCRQTEIYYATNQTNSDKRYREDVKPGYYQVFDGESTKDTRDVPQKLRIFYFDWCRNEDTVEAISELLIDRFKNVPRVVVYSENSYKNCHIEKGDFLRFSSELSKDDDGLPLVNQIGQVIEREQDLDEFTCQFVLRDTGDYWPAPPELWDGTAYTGEGTFGGDRERRIFA